jgi:hypothetical protein
MNDVDAFIFVGFNSRVAALHRDSGDILWQWKSPKGSCPYVSVLLDGDRLVVSVNGYTNCLDAFTGEEVVAQLLLRLWPGLSDNHFRARLIRRWCTSGDHRLKPRLMRCLWSDANVGWR